MIGAGLMLGRTALSAFKTAASLRNSSLGNVNDHLGLNTAGKTSGKTGFWANARKAATNALRGVSLKGNASFDSVTGLLGSAKVVGQTDDAQKSTNNTMLLVGGAALLLLLMMKK